jgi:transcriptional regulator with XRE-family HTH domain
MLSVSHFIREFEDLVREHTNFTPARVWTLAGMDRSMLSRIRSANARQPNIQFDDLPRVAASIGPEDIIYLRLLRARLLDQCTQDRRATRINVEVSNSRISGGPLVSVLRDMPLQPPQWESALRNILLGMRSDSGLRETILWLGNEVFANSSQKLGSADTVYTASMDNSDARVVAAVKHAAEKRKRS